MGVRKCENCKKDTKNNRFCSSSCSASYNNSKRKRRTEESRLKSSASAKKYYKNLSEKEKQKRLDHLDRIRELRTFDSYKKRNSLYKKQECSYCKKEFNSKRNPSGHYPTLCSDKCYKSMKTYNAKGIKRQEYRGIVFDSGYEVRIAKFLDGLNIEWSRDRVVYWEDSKGKQRRYFPDFYLPAFNLYLDPKNKYCVEQQKEKLKKVEKQINLVYGHPKDLEKKIISLLNRA